MTIIAWDGTILAADRQGTNGDTRVLSRKVRFGRDGVALATTGPEDSGEALIQWFEAQHRSEPLPWPEVQKTDDWARLIVVNKTGAVMGYYRQPIPIPRDDPFMAWGSGADAALGALACGTGAIEAVRIASRFNIYCGMGVDWINPRTGERGSGA